MVQADPCRAAGRIEQGIEQRPIADCVRAIEHCLGLAIGAGNATRVEMVASDDDGSRELSPPNHVVESQTEPMALTKPYPADSCREALEVYPLASHIEPIVEVRIVGDQFLDLGIRPINVLGVT